MRARPGSALPPAANARPQFWITPDSSQGPQATTGDIARMYMNGRRQIAVFTEQFLNL